MTAQLNVVSSPADDQKVILSDAKYLVEYFCHECGFKPLPFMAREFARYLHLGYEREMLEMVVDLTARAPRPSFAYFNAVMAHAYGFKTVSDFLFYRRHRSEDQNLSSPVDLDNEIIRELEAMK